MGYTDEFAFCLTCKQNANLKSLKKSHFSITYRLLKKVDVNSLIKDLTEITWSILNAFENDPDEMLSTWETLVFEVVDRTWAVSRYMNNQIPKYFSH